MLGLKLNHVSKRGHWYWQKEKTTVIHVALNIENSTISEVSNTEYLGVYTDIKLTWKKHVNNIAGIAGIKAAV